MIIEENPLSKEEDIENECIELVEVKKAVEKLNGDNKTAVILRRDDDNYMVVGGGANGKYVVTAVLRSKNYAMANKFDVVKAPIELTVGGKKKNYPSKRCLNLEMVLEAAKHFADRGALAQTFNWETN